MVLPQHINVVLVLPGPLLLPRVSGDNSVPGKSTEIQGEIYTNIPVNKKASLRGLFGDASSSPSTSPKAISGTFLVLAA